MSAAPAEFLRVSFPRPFPSLLRHRRAWDAIANHADGFTSLRTLIVGSVFDHVDVGHAAQRQRQRAGLARASQRLGLLRPQLERNGLADNRVLAVLLFWGLIDREDANVRKNDFRVDHIGCARKSCVLLALRKND